MITIYKITNPLNESYIGRTTNIEERLNKYKRMQCNTQKKLYNSLMEYGFEAHLIEKIDTAKTIYEGYIKESYYIYNFNCIENGLNSILPNKPSGKNKYIKNTNEISVNYTCKYRINFAPHYVFTTYRKCYNLKTGRFIKQVYKSGCIGYVISGKFYSLTRLRNNLELIPENQYLLDKITNSLVD